MKKNVLIHSYTVKCLLHSTGNSENMFIATQKVVKKKSITTKKKVKNEFITSKKIFLKKKLITTQKIGKFGSITTKQVESCLLQHRTETNSQSITTQKK